MRGGGTAGPSGEVENERAGEPGEYHHSRNFMKKMAVGSRSLRDSNKACGEAKSRRRIQPSGVRGPLGDVFAVAAAARYSRR
jgi:hypothetical protein